VVTSIRRNCPVASSSGWHWRGRWRFHRACCCSTPGLLLLDEPLSALDAKVRTHLREEIKSLQRRLGITTIMITHDQEVADRIVVMRDGRIEQTGTPLEIYHQPASLFVAEFIGAMNLLPATRVGHGEIQLGSARLACAVEGYEPGAAVRAAVRPEDIVCTGKTNRRISFAPERPTATPTACRPKCMIWNLWGRFSG